MFVYKTPRNRQNVFPMFGLNRGTLICVYLDNIIGFEIGIQLPNSNLSKTLLKRNQVEWINKHKRLEFIGSCRLAYMSICISSQSASYYSFDGSQIVFEKEISKHSNINTQQTVCLRARARWLTQFINEACLCLINIARNNYSFNFPSKHLLSCISGSFFALDFTTHSRSRRFMTYWRISEL